MTKGLPLLIAGALLAGCNSDKLNIPLYNAPTPGAIAADPITGVPLLANGIMNGDRTNLAGFIQGVGIFGREDYQYFPTDGRFTAHYLQQNPLDPAGFASGLWQGRYQILRYIYNYQTTIAATSLSAPVKAAAKGFGETYAGLEYYYLIETRFNLGIPVDVYANPTQLAPFVSRDSAYSLISSLLDAGAADLQTGISASFPFSFPAGFAGFTTPAGFLKFNRALAARVLTERGNLGCASCYQAALTATNASFIATDGSVAGLNVGLYYNYSTAPGETQNGDAPQNSPYFVAHVSFVADSAEKKADGTPDNRYLAKIRVLPSPQKAQNPTLGLTTPIIQNVFTSQTSPIPIIRNEELILNRAEIEVGLGNFAGALNDINYIRTVPGGLAPSSLTVGSSKDQFITEILKQRKWSLYNEGHRWFDVRSYNRLTDLPLDLPSHFRQLQMPIPQAECLQRQGTNLYPPACTQG